MIFWGPEQFGKEFILYLRQFKTGEDVGAKVNRLYNKPQVQVVARAAPARRVACPFPSAACAAIGFHLQVTREYRVVRACTTSQLDAQSKSVRSRTRRDGTSSTLNW